MKTALTKFMRKYDPTFQDKNITYVHLVTKASRSRKAFSFCQASDEQTAIKLVRALNDTLNTDLFPDLGKFL